MRVFLGLYSEQLSQETLTSTAQLLSGAPLHDPKDRHMTLCFLGEQSAAQLERLIEKIESCYSEGLFRPIVWDTLNISDFPRHKPKVLAVTGNSNDHLMGFQRRIAELCGSELAYQFIPHVTLAYLYQACHREVKFEAQWCFNQLRLYRSYTQQERDAAQAQSGWARSRYEVIKSWML